MPVKDIIPFENNLKINNWCSLENLRLLFQPMMLYYFLLNKKNLLTGNTQRVTSDACAEVVLKELVEDCP